MTLSTKQNTILFVILLVYLGIRNYHYDKEQDAIVAVTCTVQKVEWSDPYSVMVSIVIVMVVMTISNVGILK